jgi:hypothetical protein
MVLPAHAEAVDNLEQYVTGLRLIFLLCLVLARASPLISL